MVTPHEPVVLVVRRKPFLRQRSKVERFPETGSVFERKMKVTLPERLRWSDLNGFFSSWEGLVPRIHDIRFSTFTVAFKVLMDARVASYRSA